MGRSTLKFRFYSWLFCFWTGREEHQTRDFWNINNSNPLISCTRSVSEKRRLNEVVPETVVRRRDTQAIFVCLLWMNCVFMKLLDIFIAWIWKLSFSFSPVCGFCWFHSMKTRVAQKHCCCGERTNQNVYVWHVRWLCFSSTSSGCLKPGALVLISSFLFPSWYTSAHRNSVTVCRHCVKTILVESKHTKKTKADSLEKYFVVCCECLFFSPSCRVPHVERHLFVALYLCNSCSRDDDGLWILGLTSLYRV